jgi:hypothetical protein
MRREASAENEMVTIACAAAAIVRYVALPLHGIL